MSISKNPNPCLSCGACCAAFRVSFYWTETADIMPGGVPQDLTEDLPPHFRVMRGTNQHNPRCVALEGDVGRAVRCSIHPSRSSSCRDFMASYFDGLTQNSRCDDARARRGLPPLKPNDWIAE